MTVRQRHDRRLSGLDRRFAVCRRAGLIAMAGLLLVTAAGAEPLSLDIREAHVDRDRRTGAAVVSVTLTEGSKAAFGRFSQDNVGHRVELRVDGKPIVALVIREPILGGSLQMSGTFDAAAVAERLSKGAGKIEAEILPD
jgi:preprotein translocase subunit SecD